MSKADSGIPREDRQKMLERASDGIDHEWGWYVDDVPRLLRALDDAERQTAKAPRSAMDNAIDEASEPPEGFVRLAVRPVERETLRRLPTGLNQGWRRILEQLAETVWTPLPDDIPGNVIRALAARGAIEIAERLYRVEGERRPRSERRYRLTRAGALAIDGQS